MQLYSLWQVCYILAVSCLTNGHTADSAKEFYTIRLFRVRMGLTSLYRCSSVMETWKVYVYVKGGTYVPFSLTHFSQIDILLTQLKKFTNLIQPNSYALNYITKNSLLTHKLLYIYRNVSTMQNGGDSMSSYIWNQKQLSWLLEYLIDWLIDYCFLPCWEYFGHLTKATRKKEFWYAMQTTYFNRMIFIFLKRHILLPFFTYHAQITERICIFLYLIRTYNCKFKSWYKSWLNASMRFIIPL